MRERARTVLCSGSFPSVGRQVAMATMISPLFLMRVPSADMKERVTFDPDGRSPIRDQQGEFGDVSIIPDTQPPVTSLNMLKSLLIFVDALISYLIPTLFIILFAFFCRCGNVLYDPLLSGSKPWHFTPHHIFYVKNNCWMVAIMKSVHRSTFLQAKLSFHKKLFVLFHFLFLFPDGYL